MLFDIDEATTGRDNHPAWTDLFVKAIANCVMAASGYAAPPREVALARDAWLDRRGELSLDAMLGGMASGLKGLFGGYREQTWRSAPSPRLTQQKVEIVTHEAVTAAEATWLAARIGRDGRMSPNERALLDVPEDGEPIDRSGAQGAGGKGGRGRLSRIGGRDAGPMPASHGDPPWQTRLDAPALSAGESASRRPNERSAFFQDPEP